MSKKSDLIKKIETELLENGCHQLKEINKFKNDDNEEVHVYLFTYRFSDEQGAYNRIFQLEFASDYNFDKKELDEENSEENHPVYISVPSCFSYSIALLVHFGTEQELNDYLNLHQYDLPTFYHYETDGKLLYYFTSVEALEPDELVFDIMQAVKKFEELGITHRMDIYEKRIA